MTTVNDIFVYLDEQAPFSIQMDFDNAGFLVGRRNAPVKKVLITLDITEEVAQEAVEVGGGPDRLSPSGDFSSCPFGDGCRPCGPYAADAGGGPCGGHLRPHQSGRGGGRRE